MKMPIGYVTARNRLFTSCEPELLSVLPWQAVIISKKSLAGKTPEFKKNLIRSTLILTIHKDNIIHTGTKILLC